MKRIIKFFRIEKTINTNFDYNLITRIIPIIVCGGIFVMTIILFAFGPYDWHLTNPVRVYSFLVLCAIFLFGGYFLGVRKKIKSKKFNIDLNKIMYISFIVSIIVYFATVWITTGKVFPDVITGILDSGNAYHNSHVANADLLKYVTYFSILMSPATCFITPITLLYFKNLNKSARTMGITMIILNLLLGISQGVVNSVFLFVFQIILILIIILVSKWKTINWKRRCAILGIAILGIVIFILYYSVVMSNRLRYDITENDPGVEENAGEETDENVNTDKNVDININNSLEVSGQFFTATLKDHYFLSFLPDSIEPKVNHLISYVTHGYKGLSYALEEEFTSSYGLGFSDFFRHNFLKVIGQEELEQSIYERTYMHKISTKYGWSTGAVWSSFFIFPASDIGFTPTIMIIGIIGYLFGMLWNDFLKNKNAFAGILFYNICIMICFFSANNQLFQNGGSFLVMIFISICWILSKTLVKGE